jgi:hypothetical protein
LIFWIHLSLDTCVESNEDMKTKPVKMRSPPRREAQRRDPSR